MTPDYLLTWGVHLCYSLAKQVFAHMKFSLIEPLFKKPIKALF